MNSRTRVASPRRKTPAVVPMEDTVVEDVDGGDVYSEEESDNDDLFSSEDEKDYDTDEEEKDYVEDDEEPEELEEDLEEIVPYQGTASRSQGHKVVKVPDNMKIPPRSTSTKTSTRTTPKSTTNTKTTVTTNKTATGASATKRTVSVQKTPNSVRVKETKRTVSISDESSEDEDVDALVRILDKGTIATTSPRASTRSMLTDTSGPVEKVDISAALKKIDQKKIDALRVKSPPKLKGARTVTGRFAYREDQVKSTRKKK